jgi:predicted Zn-dependent protease
VEADPMLAEGWELIGLLQRRSGHPREAERAFRRQLYLEPDSPLVHFHLGALYRELGRPADAAATLAKRHRIIFTFRRAVAAAAVIALALIGLLDHRATDSNNIYQAAIMPAAIWGSVDVAADDLDLARFNAEARQIEAQLQALDAGDDEAVDTGTVEELDKELKQIESELRKG